MSEESFKIIKEIDSTKNYSLVVGIAPGDKVASYLIFNKNHDVLEFAHNVLAYALDAMDDLQDKLDGYYKTQEAANTTNNNTTNKTVN